MLWYVLLYLSTVLFCWCIISLTTETVALGPSLEAFTRASVVSFLESCCLLLDLWDFLYWKHLRRNRALNNASLVVLRISAALKSINEEMKFKYMYMDSKMFSVPINQVTNNGNKTPTTKFSYHQYTKILFLLKI